MQYLIAVFLAVLQGVTEFLPISSSGHLAVAQHFLGFAEPPVAFDVVLHLGTLVAVMIFYRHDLLPMCRECLRPAGILRPDWTTDNPAKLIVLLFVACVPTALMGFFLKSRVESAFSDIRHMGIEFLISGVMIAVTVVKRKSERTLAGMRISDAFIIGVAQGISLFPAISRSAATISAALLLGITPVAAARFSFLLSVPAVMGACLLEAPAIQSQLYSGSQWSMYLVSASIAGVVGFLSIKVLLNIMKSSKFHYFAVYCWIAGAALLLS